MDSFIEQISMQCVLYIYIYIYIYILPTAVPTGSEDMGGDHSVTAIEPGGSQADGRQAMSRETST